MWVGVGGATTAYNDIARTFFLATYHLWACSDKIADMDEGTCWIQELLHLTVHVRPVMVSLGGKQTHHNRHTPQQCL